MIVTCPSCSAKYRVRDEAVPPGGAELECPECSSHFIAHPPSTEDLNRAIDRLTDAKEVLEAKVEELEEKHKKAQAEAEEQKRELNRFKNEGSQAVKARDEEIARLRVELEAKSVEVQSARAEASRLRSAVEDAQKVGAELGRVQQEANTLRERLNAMGSLHAELELARQRIRMLEQISPTSYGGDSAALEREVKSLRDQLAAALAKTGGGNGAVPAELASIVSAMGPMLWGLQKAIEYLEPFAGNEPALAGHVRQLRLLAGLITRLTTETGAQKAV